MHFQYFSVMGVKLLIREYENPNRDDNRPLRSHLNLLETHFAVIISLNHHASLPRNGTKGSNLWKNGWIWDRNWQKLAKFGKNKVCLEQISYFDML